MTIDPLFSFTQLNDEGKAKAAEIAVVFTELLRDLEELIPGNSREFSIAKTKLEEASFFAKKALCHYEGNRA